MSQSEQSEHPDQPEQPDQPPTDPALGDRIRAKLDEYEVERHLSDLAATVEGVVREGITRAGELVHDHKDDIGDWLDKAAGIVDRRTDGKHAEKIDQVRGSLERGVEKLADQRHGGAPETPGEADDVPSADG
jgi:hypothetical protein